MILPKYRMRRRRGSESMRALTRETRLHVSDLVLPIFVAERESDAGPVSSMPGVERYAVSQLERLAERLNGSGVPAVMLFGIPAKKMPTVAALGKTMVWYAKRCNDCERCCRNSRSWPMFAFANTPATAIVAC